MHSRLRVLTGLLVAALGFAVHAQQVIRAGVTLTRLEVGVFDDGGRPVRDLKGADFTITQAGAACAVRQAEFISLEAPAATGPAVTFASDVVSNTPGARMSMTATSGAVMFLLDDATPMDASEGIKLRDIAMDAVKRLSDGDAGAVMFARATTHTEFVRSNAPLVAAAKTFRPAVGAAGTFMQFDDSAAGLYRTMLDSVRRGASLLAQQPGRRKLLVLFSVGLPLQFDNPAVSHAGLEAALIEEFHRVVEYAASVGVRIIAVDPGGLREGFVGLQSMQGTSGKAIQGSPNRDFLASMAATTGGAAITNTNAPLPLLDRAMLESNYFYVVHCEASADIAAASAQNIKVTVARNRSAVRLRVLPANAAIPQRATLASALRETATGVSLEMAAAPIVTSLSQTPTVATVIGVRRSTLNAAAPVEENLTVVVNAFRESGDSAGSRTTNIRTTLPAGKDDVTFDVLSALSLPPGRYRLTAAVESKPSGDVGSVSQSVDVPDFKKLPASLSGLSVAITPRGMTGPLDAFSAVLSIVPTAKRTIAVAERADAEFAVCRTDRDIRPLDVRRRIVSEDGQTSLSETEQIPRSELVNGCVGRKNTVPIADLKPGAYFFVVDLPAASNDATPGPFLRSARFEKK